MACCGGEICFFLFNLEAANFRAEISDFLIKPEPFPGIIFRLIIPAPTPTSLFTMPGFAANLLTELFIKLTGFRLSQVV